MSGRCRCGGRRLGIRGLAALLGFPVALAAAPAWGLGALSVEVVNGHNLVVDSNVTAPSTYAPKSAFIGAKICNTGDAPLANVTALVGDYRGGVGDTPGLFPVKSFGVGSPAWLNGTGNYSLTLEAGGTGAADGSRYSGTLAAGECRMEYWLLSYPQCVNVGGAPDAPPCTASITGGVKPDDDLSLDYDVWATTSSAIAQPTVSVTRTLTLRNEISASANKIWPNTASKVPDAYLDAIQSVIGWGTLGPDGQPLTPASTVYPGQRLITTQGIWYDLGNVGAGFDNNGDLVPDQNAWLQPVGDPGSFDADCFRLVNVYGVVIVKLKTGGELLIPFQNRLYFENLPDNTGVVGLVYYQFVATDAGCSANMTPYQESASGFDNEKFSADYGLALGLASRGYGAGLSFTKTDGVPTVAPGGTLTYTLAAANTGTGVNLGAPDLGLPLVLRETISAGATYVAGSAVTGLTAPAGTGSYTQGYTDTGGSLDPCTIAYSVSSSSYVVFYSADGGATWSLSEPVPAGTVTNLQWLLSTRIALDGGHDGAQCIAPDGTFNDGVVETSLPAGQTASVTFGVTVNLAAPFPGPVLCNSGGLGYGSATPGVTARDCDVVTGGNALSGTVFRDDGGTGGIYGNGVQDNATETGLGAGVGVELYYDANGDGKYDAGDLRVAGASTAANGTYSFSSLADGPYLVVVRKYGAAGANNDVNDFVPGWGDTTVDPNLPLTTDQGILVLGEDPDRVTLAVNVDYNRDSGAQTVANVSFAFAPPLRLTKKVTNNPDANADFVADTAIDEGQVFSYSITLENRLPSVGRQGPAGCEYTFWAPDGVNGGNNKDFTNPTDAWDSTGPNGSVASALITGNPNRFVYGRYFRTSPQAGVITRVEALAFGYFSAPLNNDNLTLTARIGTNSSTTTLTSSMIDNYIGPRPDFDPNSAISWNVTTARPGGGTWAWSDFYNTQFEINPNKTAGSDQQTFYLDAIGFRVTTDHLCEANPSTTLGPVPLQDRYDIGRISFVSADPAPSSVDTATGVVRWDDVGPIPPGSTRTVTVQARSLNVSGTQTGSCAAFAPPVTEPAGQPPAWNTNCNYAQTAFAASGAAYADGRAANNDYGKMATTFQGQGEIRGIVWNDNNCSGGGSGWPKGACEPGLPNVAVTLFACVMPDGSLETRYSNKSCVADYGDAWRVIATSVTGAGGVYEFLGLRTGVYIVEVGDTDGAPGTGNVSPYGGTQTAEPLDTQTVTAGNANGATCAGACNNTWGDPNANLGTMNQINNPTGEEIINGVNFGYNAIAGSLYGRVWHDIDGDAAYPPEAGEGGLAGFAVEVHAWTDGNANGRIDPGEVGAATLATSITSANGDYGFTGLAAAGYAIRVRPPALPSTIWTQTHESAGGTADLDSMIPVTLGSGAVSGSHDFGYTQGNGSDIGDTLWFDFDGDGIPDATEAGIPDVTVRLYNDVDRDGGVDAGVDELRDADVTDVSGKYLFQDLPAGSYVVQVDTTDPDFPGGAVATGDPDLPTGSIGDLVYYDADASGGFTAGDEGIANVVVVLYEDTDASGLLEVGTDALVAATVTGVDGRCFFTGLHAGSYFVDVADDASDPNGNTLPSGALTLVGADPKNALVTLATNSTQVLAADAGYSPAVNYALGNRVWSDADGDGAQDAGETGLANVSLRVWTASAGDACFSGDGGATGGCVVATDVAGFWLCTGLTAARSYTATVLTATLPRNFQPTTPAGAPSNSRTIASLPSSDLLNFDFGYRYDCQPSGGSCSPDGVADRDPEDPTGSINGRVYRDANNNGVYDPGEALGGTAVNLLANAGYAVATTTTAADGTYSFTSATGTGVPPGTYAVQTVASLGTRSSVVFLAASQSVPNIDVVYGGASETVADSYGAVSVDGVHNDLNQDFGYQRFLGSIGDTVYQDANGNATQDPGEPGSGGVTVNLFLCGWTDNGNGLFESGEETGCAAALATTVTAADDPLTAADEGGKYLFSNLDTPPANRYYVVRVDAATLPGTASTLSADPDTDGVACTLLPDPDVAGDEFPPPSVCDSAQLVPSFVAGINYLGADFGYLITGDGFGTIGDHLWLDADGDGTLDDGEKGIPYVTVWLDADNDDVVDAGERAAQTDADGSYLLTNLADGTYANLKVLSTGPDWPAGLPTTPTFEVRSSNTGSRDGIVPSIVISGGAVTTIDDGFAGNDPDTCTGCNLAVDFGYRYAGANALSGTICTESIVAGPPAYALNGYCGDTAVTYAGAGTGESPLAGVVVTLYRWNDSDSDGAAWSPATGVLDAGDTFTLLGSTATNAGGDYSFANVPAGNLVVVLSVSDTQRLRLTTTQGNTSLEGRAGLQLYEGTSPYQGNTVTVLARQAIAAGGDTVDVDYAFDGTLGGALAYDFGDLPDSGTPDYDATLLASDGARHALAALRLGATVSAETDGRDAPLADLDADDGITLLTMDWVVGAEGAAVEATVSAAGWLAGWIDFNGDGDFTDAGEAVVNRAVAAGANLVSFDVPAGIDGSGLIFFSRFRIYPARPLMVSSTGIALDAQFQVAAGEVEDYRWNVNVTPAVISSFTGCDAGGAVALEWRTSSGAATLGFILRRWDEGRREFVDAGGRLLPALLGAPRGVYRFLDAAAAPDRPQAYELLEIEAMGRSTLHGPYTVDARAGACGGDPPVEYQRAPVRAAAARPAPRPAAVKQESGFVAPAAVGGAKIATTDESVHFLSVGALARALGTTRAEVRRGLRENRYGLSTRGKQVAYLAAEELEGLWFFAQRQRSPFARENVYRLEARAAGGLAMAVRDEDAFGRGTGRESFPRVVQEERDLIPGLAIFTDVQRDHWLWDYFVAGEPAKTYPVRADAVAPDSAEASLTLLLIGATDTEADPDHHAQVRLNGVDIGEVRWNGLATQQATLTFDAALLADGENAVEVAALADTAAPYGIFYLDSFVLRYRSRYQARGDRLAFSAGGNPVVRVSGFGTPNVLLFDVTRAKRPVRILATPFADGAGSWGVAIAPQSPDARYEALTREAAAAPAWVAADAPSALRDPRNRGRYVVVTTRDLLGPARRLAELRGGIVADIEDVYDEFNHGSPSPFALRRFLTYATRRWRVRPRYVVLAGDGTFDYRDNLGVGGNLIPPMMIGTGQGLFPSDTWFADSAGGPAPELAIGRLPVASAAELDRLIDKIILRESTPDRAWTASLLALADDADRAGDFPADSDRIAALAPPALTVNRIHLGALTLAAARAGLFAAVRDGAGLVNYVGHAGYDVLATEGLLTSADVDLLENAARPTVLTAMTCLAGDFAFPGSPGLAELLVRRETGGAAAVWAPTGLSVNDPAVRLAEGFYAAAFAGTDAVRIGDVVLAAQRAYEQARNPAALLRIYVLLGDPAMRLR